MTDQSDSPVYLAGSNFKGFVVNFLPLAALGALMRIGAYWAEDSTNWLKHLEGPAGFLTGFAVLSIVLRVLISHAGLRDPSDVMVELGGARLLSASSNLALGWITAASVYELNQQDLSTQAYGVAGLLVAGVVYGFYFVTFLKVEEARFRYDLRKQTRAVVDDDRRQHNARIRRSRHPAARASVKAYEKKTGRRF